MYSIAPVSYTHLINHVSSQIKELMETRIQGEKEKKDLEIKMLQAQINPHFLYNTLDSIRWIATMQKNSGIVQMVTSLSSLLRNMACLLYTSRRPF